MNHSTDVLVIGSGIAGLFTALKVSEFANVILVTKKNKAESNTNYAQGGIASVFDQTDSFEKHIQDTLIAGAGLCKYEAVKLMVEEGPDRINDLIEIGTKFTKKDGELDLAREGGHSMNRIVHAKDFTGQEIERALIENIQSRKNITILENLQAIDLITEHNVNNLKQQPLNNRNCWGAFVLDVKTNKVSKIISKVTVLSTGGLGQVYLHTTNPSIATGDGFAMAYRAGASIGNMEFIQFHPTSLFGSSKSSNEPSFLISEAVRGFGGLLFTKSGLRFMPHYDKRNELAPRDIVARAIDNELKRTGDDYVLLDISHKSEQEIVDHFPMIYNKCLSLGIDISKQPIPVVPAAHYACGGIIVDEFARTSLKGLYACGEVTMTGVHGANRLASNSLLEAIVYGYRASLDIRKFIKTSTLPVQDIPDWDDSGTLSADEKVLITHSVKEIKDLMWTYVGIVRSNERLERASKRIHNIFMENEELYKKTKVSEDLIELRNLTAVAHMIVKSALLRKESRGLHYTLSYPNLLDQIEDTILQNNNP